MAVHDILRPTLVQAGAFGPIVKGRDVIMRAETGSGKTLAYLLPLVNRIYHLHDRARQAAQDPDAPNPLQRSRPWVVLTPTSDLAAQVLAMLEAIDCNRLVNAQSLTQLFRWEAVRPTGSLLLREQDSFAGSFQEPRPKERTTLVATPGQKPREESRGPESTAYVSSSPRIRWGSTDIVVTTPLKFCEELAHFKEDGLYPACVVMDEADALFQGFTRVYLFEIFGALRPRPKIRQADEERQRLPDMIPTQFVFSAATMVHVGPFSEGNMLIERFCTADVVETPQFHKLPAGISMDNVHWIPGSDDWHQRVEQLIDVLRETPRQRTLIFVNSLHNCHVLLHFFRDNGWPVVSFMKGPRGRMGPRFRDAQKFVDGEASIMVATEFGGRGIDWHQVDHVINFQMPTGAVCWLHRVGRTGRMGQGGRVTNFIGSKDQVLSKLIRDQLQAGEDLHTLFSRKRSLRKRLRNRPEDDGPASDEEGGDGPVSLDGGLEILGKADRVQGAEGELLGYLTSPVMEESSSRLPRAKARKATAAAEASAASSKDGVTSGDGLSDIRERLLASESESDNEEQDSGSEEEGKERSHGKPGQEDRAPFSWSQFAKEGEAALGPVPTRQLERAGGGDRIQAATFGGRYTDQDRLPGSRRIARRKALGVRTKNRLDAGRNYASPDDDLLV